MHQGLEVDKIEKIMSLWTQSWQLLKSIRDDVFKLHYASPERRHSKLFLCISDLLSDTRTESTIYTVMIEHPSKIPLSQVADGILSFKPVNSGQVTRLLITKSESHHKGCLIGSLSFVLETRKLV